MDSTYNINRAFKPAAKRLADLNGADFYPTPRWATYALINSEHFDGDIWEPACGDGSMSEVLAETGNLVISSDLFERGYGEGGINYLTEDRRVANVITNPPYNAAEGFVTKSLEVAEKKFALLLRLAFLEGASRANTIFHKNPPSRVWVFSERITFYQKGAVIAGSGTTAYAWFVWDKASSRPTELAWLRPGFKARFSQAKHEPAGSNLNAGAGGL